MGLGYYVGGKTYLESSAFVLVTWVWLKIQESVVTQVLVFGDIYQGFGTLFERQPFVDLVGCLGSPRILARIRWGFRKPPTTFEGFPTLQTFKAKLELWRGFECVSWAPVVDIRNC